MSDAAPERTPQGTREAPGLLRRVVAVLGSFHLAVALLLVLFVLVFVGTFAQGHMSLYDVQRRYFDSLLAVVDVGPVSVPLPGGALALALLSLNLIVGGIARIRKRLTTAGVIVAHLGVLLLFGGGLVEALASDKGQMTLYEPVPGAPAEQSRSDRFQSYYEWEIAVSERKGDERVEHVIPWSRLEGLEGRTLRATAPGLPFEVVVWGWDRNALPRRTGEDASGAGRYEIEPLEHAMAAERNLPMAHVSLEPPGGGSGPRGLLWGGEAAPWTAAVGDRVFHVELRRRSWQLPFSVRLNRFVHERHPGTRMDSRFSSYVTQSEGAVERDVHVTMNEPLRHRGYTFYQSGWGPADAPPGARRFSTFAVVRNPSDRVPIAACGVIFLGLLFHFGLKLYRHVRSQTVSAPSPSGPPLLGGRGPGRARGAATAALLAVAMAAPASAAAPPETWTEAALEDAALVPVQQGGRVMPLDSYARYTLLRLNHKRKASDDRERRLDPVEWLLDVLFRPELARRYPCFLVEDAAVLDAAGLPHEGKKKRDRYAFEDLAPGLERLRELASQYHDRESRDLTPVENGIRELAADLGIFEDLSRYLDFARPLIPVPEAERVRALWPGRESVSALDVVAKLDDLNALLPADPHAGVPGAPQGPEAADPDGRAANELRVRAVEALQAATALRLVPPDRSPSEEREWLSPGLAVFQAVGGRDPGAGPSDVVRRLVSLVDAVGDPKAFEREMDGLRERSATLAGARGEYRKVPLEVTLTRLDPFFRAIYLYLIAFLVLAVSWARPSRWLVRGAWALLLAGVAIHATGIVIRSVIRGRPPISTLYDTTLAIAFVAVVGLLVVEAIHRRRVALALAPVVGGLLLFVGQRFEAIKGEDSMPQLVAVLDTNFWLATHVTFITIGYAGGLLASAVGHVHVLGRAAGLKRADPAFYPLLQRMTYGMLCFGLFFSVVGTILGGIWANESWGRFWGWDPKENGALMICLSQIAILHARMGGILKPFGVAVASILTGAVVAFSWWGVNLLGIGLHTYGFSGGLFRGLMIFYGIEAVVLAIASATHLAGRSYGGPGKS